MGPGGGIGSENQPLPNSQDPRRGGFIGNPAVCVAQPQACAAAAAVGPMLLPAAVTLGLVYAAWWAIDKATSDDGGDGDGNYTDRVGKIAKEASEQLGRHVSESEVRDAIHKVKNEGLGRGGPVRNPDVQVNPKTGDVRPKTPGGLGDSIGNIFDFL